jgi:hypothetical protein
MLTFSVTVPSCRRPLKVGSRSTNFGIELPSRGVCAVRTEAWVTRPTCPSPAALHAASKPERQITIPASSQRGPPSDLTGANLVASADTVGFALTVNLTRLRMGKLLQQTCGAHSPTMRPEHIPNLKFSQRQSSTSPHLSVYPSSARETPRVWLWRGAARTIQKIKRARSRITLLVLAQQCSIECEPSAHKRNRTRRVIQHSKLNRINWATPIMVGLKTPNAGAHFDPAPSFRGEPGRQWGY